METIEITLPEYLVSWLELYAEAHGLTASEVIETLLTDLLEEEGE